VGKGGVLGGVEWGPAADDQRLYVALSDESFLPARPDNPFALDPEKGGGVFAFRLDNGERLWMTAPPPCGARRPCSPAQPGAVTAIQGTLFSGSLDGHLRAYSTANGKVVWDYDTAHNYEAVNGVAGHGGSLDVAGPVVVGGTVYALSGYDQFGAAPGNVLLAFTVDGR
jgi:polyvinyl alcohol dehydrogenase (cytochrome)